MTILLTRDFAPAAMLDGVLAGNFCRHRTASVYALRSALESEPLEMISHMDVTTEGEHTILV